jgi:glycosyltransferase involved in cell wall biosynthesis
VAKVSIITPVHDRPQYLEEAVASIQQQAHPDWEHIIVDDGSTNALTQKVLKEIARLPKTIIYRTQNKGLAAARNFGIERSTGEYILTLDDDDKWHPDFISVAMDIFKKKPQTGAVTAWMQEFGFSDRTIKIGGGGVKSFLIENNSVHGMFKKASWEKAGGYDEKMTTGYEDWDFWLRITAMGYDVEVVEQPFFFYRTHPHSSLFKEARESHLVLFRYIIEKNKEIYREHITDALCLLEKKLMDTQKDFQSPGLVSKLKQVLRSQKKTN